MASELFPIIDEDGNLTWDFLRDFNFTENFGIKSSSNAYRHAEKELKAYLNAICGYELDYLFTSLMLGNEEDLQEIKDVEQYCYEFLGFKTLSNYIIEQRISGIETTNIGNSQRMGRILEGRCISFKNNINEYFKLKQNANCNCNCRCVGTNLLDKSNLTELHFNILG